MWGLVSIRTNCQSCRSTWHRVCCLSLPAIAWKASELLTSLKGMNEQPTVIRCINQHQKYFFGLVSSVRTKDESRVRWTCILMRALFSYLWKLTDTRRESQRQEGCKRWRKKSDILISWMWVKAKFPLCSFLLSSSPFKTLHVVSSAGVNVDSTVDYLHTL